MRFTIPLTNGFRSSFEILKVHYAVVNQIAKFEPFTVQGKAIPSSVREKMTERWLLEGIEREFRSRKGGLNSVSAY